MIEKRPAFNPRIGELARDLRSLSPDTLHPTLLRLTAPLHEAVQKALLSPSTGERKLRASVFAARSAFPPSPNNVPGEVIQKTKEKKSAPSDPNDQFHHRLLTHKEEIQLSEEYKAGKAAQIELHQNPTLNPDQQSILESTARKGDAAKDTLVIHNQKLVKRNALRYLAGGGSLDLDDLIQEGNIGLLRAIEKFDEKRGWRFSTYATWWIRQAMTRAISEKSRDVRRPGWVEEMNNKINITAGKMSQDLGREPTEAELAACLDMTEGRVHEILNAPTPVSLDCPAGKDSEARLGDFIPDTNAENPEEEAIKSDERHRVESWLKDNLSSREETAMRYRYGLDGSNKRRTLEETGKEMGVSRERIRQIEAKALRKLRTSLQARDMVKNLT